MPIYEYQCESCGHRLEALQRLADDPLTTCPECGGQLKRLISAPAFQFKGSGWYVTDYGSKRSGGEGKGGGGEGKGGGGEGKGGGGEGKGGEAKPSGSGAEKSESKDSTGSDKAKDKPAAKSEKG